MGPESQKWCSRCSRPARGYIVQKADGNPLIPPIAICPRCDYAHPEAAGPPLTENRVKDFP